MSWAEENGFDWITEPKDAELMNKFDRLDKEDFVRQLGKVIEKKVKALITREVEPGDHPFYSKERQEETYFKHRNNDGEIIDVRNVDEKYARNLYNWYKNNHGYNEDILFMRTLKKKFEES